MAYIFTSESVSEGHPDKIADQISDALLDHFLAYDSQARVACETLVTTGQVFLAGEVHADVYVDVQAIARAVIREIGYNQEAYCFSADSCGIVSAIHEQSKEIREGVERDEEQGAGDQGLMFGYAVNETEHYMPLPIDLSHRMMHLLTSFRKEGRLGYLRPDAKAQVSVVYDAAHRPVRVEKVVLSTQHDPFAPDDERMLKKIRADIQKDFIPCLMDQLPAELRRLFDKDVVYMINPKGTFVIGGPHGDTGLTGRKIIVDTYGGRGAHGGGAFSGKDTSKVDRSGAYAARHIAKNLVAAGVADQVLVQLSYAIGVSQPTSFYVHTYGTAHVGLGDEEIGRRVFELLDFRPGRIEQRLGLRKPIYRETAAYGHMGREPQQVQKRFQRMGDTQVMDVDLFTWEKLDVVAAIRSCFSGDLQA